MRLSKTSLRFHLGAALGAALFALTAAAQPAKKPTPAAQAAIPPRAAAPAPVPAKPYHLELEANATAPFPWLGKFGTIAVHVFPGGVRAESVWLNGFSKNGEKTITVENPLGRMYTEVPINEISNVLGKLGGLNDDKTYTAIATLQSPVAGKVMGMDAMRYRLKYSDVAWIDVWTAPGIPENPQVKRIVTEIVYSISPGTGAMSRSIPGTPIYVELNFSHYKKLPILKLKSLKLDNKGETEALSVGSLYMKAPLIDQVWK